MTPEFVIQLISQAAFPIAAYIMMFWYIKDEMKTMREALQNNTIALTTLIEHFHKEGGE